MTSPLTVAILKSGLISPAALAEFRRWKTIDLPEELPVIAEGLEQVAQSLASALEGDGLVISRETDLDILKQFLDTQRQGNLHVEIYREDVTEDTDADISISFGITPLGEYIIPWRSESIVAELTNGFCYLDAPGIERVFFAGVRELFYGDHKAFMVCVPRREE